MQVEVVFVSFAHRETELLVIEFGRNPGRISYLNSGVFPIRRKHLGIEPDLQIMEHTCE